MTYIKDGDYMSAEGITSHIDTAIRDLVGSPSHLSTSELVKMCPDCKNKIICELIKQIPTGVTTTLVKDGDYYVAKYRCSIL